MPGPTAIGTSAAGISPCPFSGVQAMGLGTILLIVLVLILIGALPRWPHSANWGYYPSGGLGIVIVVIIVLLLVGRI
jgi:Protein of unknown function (DUF3309)